MEFGQIPLHYPAREPARELDSVMEFGLKSHEKSIRGGHSVGPSGNSKQNCSWQYRNMSKFEVFKSIMKSDL